MSIQSLAHKLIHLIRQKDTPHRIALGLALGIFVGILPIMGIQMSVVTIIALPLRANLKAAVAGVWISNPITFIPMYFGYYKLGLLFFPSREISWETFMKMIVAAGEIEWSAPRESLTHIWVVTKDILIPMWTGATILAIVFGILTYFVTQKAVVAYRAKRSVEPVSQNSR